MIEEDVDSGIQPILKPLKSDDLVSFDHQDAQLFIDLYPVQDLSPAIDGSDASLRPLLKYTEGDSFDLRGISSFLSSPDTDPNLQCAALQLLEHAAEWQSTNFTECMPETFGPVAKLVLDSRGIQVRCAALDTLKVFLASPHAADIVKSMMPPGVVDAVSDNLSSPEPLVQLASVELLDIASRSEEILIVFAPAVLRISSVLPSMPTDTQVTALRVLEICAGSHTHELVEAVASTSYFLNELLSSPETSIQIAALKVLEAGAGTEDPDLARVFKTILPVVKKIQSSRETDVHSAVRQDPPDTHHHTRTLTSSYPPLRPYPSVPTNSVFLPASIWDTPSVIFTPEPYPALMSSSPPGSSPPGPSKQHSHYLPDQRQVHSLDETFHCLWDDGFGKRCNTLFNRKNLSAHLREAHRIRGPDMSHIYCRWDCCGRGLKKENLVRHMNSMHLGTTCCCDTCGRSFSRRDTLNRHEQNCLGSSKEETSQFNSPSSSSVIQ